MSDAKPDFQNKTSFENYTYYKMIRQKMKKHKGALLIAEALFLFLTFFFYWVASRHIFMPALYVAVIKDIFLIISPRKHKAVIFLAGDTVTMLILMIQSAVMANSSIPLDITANIFFYPAVFISVKSIKYEYVEDKLSMLKDYPYFSLDLYKPDETEEYTEFDDDRGDRFLKTAMLDVYTENTSKKIRIAKFCVFVPLAITFVIFISSQFTAVKLNKTEKYTPDKICSEGEYVNVDVVQDTITVAGLGNEKVFWIRIKDGENYVCVHCSESTYNNITADNSTNISGKIKFAKEGEISNATLTLPVFGTHYYETDENKREYLDSIASCKLYIQAFDEQIMSDIGFYCFIFILIFLIAYGLLIVLPRKNYSSV